MRSRTRSSRWSGRSLISRAFGIEVGDRQVGLAKRRAGDREGIDRVGLAELALRSAAPRHQLRRDADHALSSGDQLALEATGDVATVLERKQPLSAEGAGPFEQALVAGLVACDRQLVVKARRLVELTAAAVWLFLWGSMPIVITACAPPMLGVSRTDLRRTRLTGARARSYQVTPAILGRRRATQRERQYLAGRCLRAIWFLSFADPRSRSIVQRRSEASPGRLSPDSPATPPTRRPGAPGRGRGSSPPRR